MTQSYEVIGTSRLVASLPDKPHNDIPEVLDTMNGIGALLGRAGLTHVVPFNTVYRELTGVVQQGVEQTGVFEQPETVRRTVGIFAQLYFDPLRAYAEGRYGDIPGAWQELLCDDRSKKAPAGVQFLEGMIAHIVYDLPQALSTSGVDTDYYDDYQSVVGMLIDTTAHRLSRSYVPGPNLIRNSFTRATVRAIARWREQAWHDGLALQGAGDDSRAVGEILSRLDKTAQRKARYIHPIGSFILNCIDR